MVEPYDLIPTIEMVHPTGPNPHRMTEEALDGYLVDWAMEDAEADDTSEREGLSDVYSDMCEFPEVSDVESDS